MVRDTTGPLLSASVRLTSRFTCKVRQGSRPGKILDQQPVAFKQRVRTVTNACQARDVVAQETAREDTAHPKAERAQDDWCRARPQHNGLDQRALLVERLRRDQDITARSAEKSCHENEGAAP